MKKKYLWSLLPLFFGIFGSVISWTILAKKDRKLANLQVWIGLTTIFFFAGLRYNFLTAFFPSIIFGIVTIFGIRSYIKSRKK